MFHNCSFTELPPFCKDLRGVGLIPSLWTGAPISVCDVVKVKTGDQVQIAGIDGAGGIYIQLEDGLIIGAVDEKSLTPWGKPQDP